MLSNPTKIEYCEGEEVEIVRDHQSLSETEQLRNEVEALKDVIRQQAVVIKNIGTHIVKQEEALASPAASRPPVTKPRDIPILELNHLEGLEASAHLQMFIELVEQATPHDASRVQVAKSRLGPEIVMLIHNRQWKQPNLSWGDFCNLLKNKFAVDVNLDRAWQDLETEFYDWGESPQSFCNRAICKYATLESKFPNEKFPNRNKFLKRKVWQGLPRDLKDKLESFLDENYPLNKFLNRVEYQRQIFLETQSPIVSQVSSKHENSVRPKEGRSLTTATTPSPESENKSEIEDLKEQVKALTTQLSQLKSTNSPSQYHQYQSFTPSGRSQSFRKPKLFCPYCRSHTHNLRECASAPRDGSCFDCRRVNWRRGNRNCPGKANQDNSLIAQASTYPITQLSVNNKLLSALVDTGSSYTLMKESTRCKLGSELHQKKNFSCLQGVTGTPIRILGSVLVEIGIGLETLVKKWVPVVPNSYLQAHMLLGCDILYHSSFLWDPEKKLFH